MSDTTNTLDDLSISINFTVGQANKLLNILNVPSQAAVVDLVGFMNLIQTQAQPQVAQAKEALDAVAATATACAPTTTTGA